jgi:hypothetical protein
MKRLLAMLLLLAAPAAAQFTYPVQPGGGLAAGGGAITGAITGATGCTTPPFSFTADTNAGMCLQAADQLVLQSAASGTARGALLLAYAAAVPQVFLQAVNAGVQTGWYAEDPDSGPPKASVFVGGTEKFIFFSNPGLQIGVSAGSDPISIYPIGLGATSFEGIITSVDLTAARTWTLPNISGTFQTNAGATVASAANINLLAANVPHISGTTTITSVTIQPAGRCVTLIFDGVLTFTDGSNLKLAGDFVTTADDTISLCSDGTNWYEQGRAVN